MPYTPDESMAALRFFYYKLGDKLWSDYGFIDAFDLTTGWFDRGMHIAIDQGPIVVMIENYRTDCRGTCSCPIRMCRGDSPNSDLRSRRAVDACRRK